MRRFAPSIAALAKEHGMLIVQETYDPSTFGNAIIELTSTEFDLKVIRDRAQMWMEIRQSGKGAWFLLETVLAFIGKEVAPLDFEHAARMLAQNYSQVNAVMTSNLSRIGFTTFDDGLKQKRWEELFPPD